MTILTLKPQWCLRGNSSGIPTLTSENFHQPFDVSLAQILSKLSRGVDPVSLSDEQFDQVEMLTQQGFIDIHPEGDAPAWELSGANFHNVREQFKHVTFDVRDYTGNGVGMSLWKTLTEAGLKEDRVKPRLTLLVDDSYLDLPDVSCNALPIICNRMRVTVGPMIFPWGDHVRTKVAMSEHYLPHPNYTLPSAFDSLQRAWIGVAVLQFIGMNRLRYVGNFVEYDMAKQEFHLWPQP